MRLSLRGKLWVIIGATAFTFVLMIVASDLISRRIEGELATVEGRLLPKVELGPRLEADFERMRRAMQDAVAASDSEALAATRDLKDGLMQDLAAGRDAVDRNEASKLVRAVDDYYRTAIDVSRRLLSAETGESLVAAMADMQAKQVRVSDLLKSATGFDHKDLSNAFDSAKDQLQTAARVRLAVSVTCLVAVILLSLWLSRSVLDSVRMLMAGFRRFARSDFGQPIPDLGRDELGQVASQANQMAASLQSLADLRDHADWLKAGQAGLMLELRGQLSPEEVASRAIGFVARYVDARAAALYVSDADQTLRLLGRFALVDAEHATPAVAPRFRPGEGLVGQAAMRDDLLVVTDAPADYLRVRSGLGEGDPRAIVLLPLSHAGATRGVVELALFSDLTDRAREFLLSIRETLTISIEVARAQAATRELLAETQRQAQRLSAQEEELRANNEELQTQQEELRQSNEELTQQAEELEAQRRILQERNHDLGVVRRDLEKKAAELTTVSAYKSQFLANMSHELRTPLNSMLLLSNLLSSNETGNLTERQVEYAATIYAAGRDLLGLINQVLDLAKIEAGKYDIRLAPLPLAELARPLERVFLPLARDKGLQLKIELEGGLPDAILTDKQRVEQILNNLLANAIKFTARGEVALRIQRPAPGVQFRREDLRRDKTVALVVCDTGLGIAPENRERIFAPFEQVDAAPDRRYGGTGLGLNIARELAHLLGGELQLDSALGKGSTFTCFLPFEAPPQPAAKTPADVAAGAALSKVVAANGQTSTGTTPVPASSPAGKPARPATTAVPTHLAAKGNGTAPRAPSSETTLLVIEDDQRFARALGEIIESQGLKVKIARDGRTGLRMARDVGSKPKGIILDVVLPDIDGWTVMEELRADPTTADIAVHFVSAVDASEHGAAVGAVGYLTKPASRTDLLRVVQSLAPESDRRVVRLLVVESTDPKAPESLMRQLAGEKLELRHASSARDALAVLGRETFNCIILDLSLPDMDGLPFLNAVRERYGPDTPSVVVYASRPLSKDEARAVEAHAEAIVLKEGSSTERLLDEVRLFVRRLNDGLGPRRPATQPPHPGDARLNGRKLLLVDDDMRTVYALSAMLRAKGVQVFAADTGIAALSTLEAHPEIEVVLMDIMMPEMDGYEAMRRIRANPQLATLPILALTAKAMKGDEEKCLDAGATAYLPKPIDPDRLVALVHTLLKASGVSPAKDV